MLLIKTNFVIKRDAQSGKKVYIDLANKRTLKYPPLPQWRELTKSNASLSDKSYVIRPDDDLIVIDCDTMETTDLVQLMIDKHSINTYITLSDNGTKHFYFRPTKYFDESPIKSTARVTADKIDILQGMSLVYTACEANPTKSVLEGDINSLADIPNDLVDILIGRSTKHLLAQTSDYEPSDTFRAPLIEQALALYARTKDYKSSLQGLFEQITPRKFKPLVAPDYHPDNVPDGEGINYLQALTSRIAGDASISPELHRELITLIATELWSEPLGKAELKAHLSNLTTQTINGKLLFRYNEHYDSGPLLSIDGQAYKQLCRDTDDNYYTVRTNRNIQKFSGFSRFAKAVKSKNYKFMIDGKDVHNIKEEILLQNISTAQIINSKKNEPGMTKDSDGNLVYNTFQPSRYLNIIRGLEDAEIPSDPDSFPTIKAVIDNLMRDNEEKEKILSLFYQFLAHKYKTFEYSPIIFQFMGIKGSGKNVLIDTILGAIDTTTESNINSSNNQFNANFADASFIQHGEEVVLKSTMDYLKKVSGRPVMRVERKGVDPVDVENISTFICTSNRAETMKEGLDDRRVVTLMSFTSSRLRIPHLTARIAKELDAFCRHLRDTILLDHATYIDANYWRDSVADAMVEEKSDHDGAAVNLMLIVSKLESDTISAPEFVRMLAEVVGDDTPFYRLGRNQQVHIPLSSNGALITDTGEPIRTPLTQREAKEHDLGKYLKRNTNKSIYTKAVYELTVTISTEMFNALEGMEGMAVETIDLEED